MCVTPLKDDPAVIKYTICILVDNAFFLVRNTDFNSANKQFKKFFHFHNNQLIVEVFKKNTKEQNEEKP